MEKEDARTILAGYDETEKVILEGTEDTFIVRFTNHSTDEGYMEQFHEAVRVALTSFINQDC